MRETKRQLVHLTGIFSIFFAYQFGSFLTGLGALVISLGIFMLSVYVEMKRDIRKRLPFRMRFFEDAEDSLHKLIDSFERDGVKRRYTGAIMFFLGIGLPLMILPFEIGILAIVVLSVGDSMSTIFGIHFGKHRLKINKKKSWEGSLSGLILSFIACLLFTNPVTALIASTTGMLTEAIPFKINDNLLMPFSIGIVLWVIKFLPF